MHEIADTFRLSSGRAGTLYRIRRDMIPDYYLLAFPKNEGEPCPADLSEMLAFGMARAQALANDRIGDTGAYSVLYSGYSARREHGWLVHIVLLTGRWKKAWLDLVLAGKNALQALGSTATMLLVSRDEHRALECFASRARNSARDQNVFAFAVRVRRGPSRIPHVTTHRRVPLAT
jgi:hypothetical protein